MQCNLALLRRTVTAALFAAVAVPIGAAGAQSSTVNFNGLPDPGVAGIAYVANCYSEGGFVITAVGLSCDTPDAFATGGPASPLFYTGSPALFLNNPGATLVDFTRADGGLFSMQSVTLTPFLVALGPNPTTVMFTGFRMSGSPVMQTIMLSSSQLGMADFALSGFTDLSSVRLSALDAFGEPVVQFDNLVFSSQVSSVPEPATFGLVAMGLVGIVAFARRRRSI